MYFEGLYRIIINNNTIVVSSTHLNELCEPFSLYYSGRLYQDEFIVDRNLLHHNYKNNRIVYVMKKKLVLIKEIEKFNLNHTIITLSY